ncbi:helix-turn-helix domain-containing protein [Devosia nitrariae]|uniref:HTH araC/xylS-type domain-containing protein n=1 Tax=Devosia nitrariae TaxID=2071872 RepID=A0ABQ5W214_9HYPH|nr:AraC family transcriptional regulator [Devosia nitrariae]GLQ54043.1 hypothetical protein GCM10010862_13020 [Devosia nitrariae]
MTPRPPAVFQKPAEPYEPRGRLDPASFDRNVNFQTLAPPPALEFFLEHLWIISWEGLEGTYRSAQVMHRPYVDVFVGKESDGIQGTFRGRRIYEAKGTGRIVGARFKPAAFRCFWPGEMSNLQDAMMPIASAFPRYDEPYRNAIRAAPETEAVGLLADLIATASPKEDANVLLVNDIIAAVEADEEMATVAGVARAFRHSERWLQQLFKDYLGVGLKWFLKRRRLLAAAERMREEGEVDWAGLAYELGYSSQQHFITDFRLVVGETPVEYRAGVRRNTRGRPSVSIQRK